MEWWKSTETVSVLTMIWSILRLIFLFHKRKIPTQFDEWIRINIWLDMGAFVIASISAACTVGNFIAISAKADLVRYIICGKVIESTSLLILFESVAVVITVVLFSFLAVNGVNGSNEDFIFYRRISYSFSALLAGVISPYIMFRYSSKVIESFRVKNIGLTCSLKEFIMGGRS
jgi:hypothetical protein